MIANINCKDISFIISFIMPVTTDNDTQTTVKSDNNENGIDSPTQNEKLVTFTLAEYMDIQDSYAEVILALEQQVKDLQAEVDTKNEN